MDSILAIVGLGNPGPRFAKTRHNIGFIVLDALAHQYDAIFTSQGNVDSTQIRLGNQPLWLIKPRTFMNDSGKIAAFLQKKSIKAQHLLVIHDELELPFGTLKLKTGGSAKGHNGLRSIMSSIGPDFHRLRIGIGRPEQKEAVPDYVLAPFTESDEEIEKIISKACENITSLLRN